MNLSDKAIKKGAQVEITEFLGTEVVCERLHEMGLRRGMQLQILGRAPFGGPLLVQFQTSVIALRADEAACAKVKFYDN